MISIYFGKPRSGKTCLLARLARRNYVKRSICRKLPFLRKILKPYAVVYCNEPTVKYTLYTPTSDLGTFCPTPHSLFLIDEAGVDLDNRAWKSLPRSAKWFAAMHGHLKCDVVLVSQTVDIDVAFRSRAQNMFIVRRSALGLTKVERISFGVDVDTDTHQLIEFYDKPVSFFAVLFGMLSGRVRYFRRRPCFKWFDSYTLRDYQFTKNDPYTHTAP